MLNGTTLSTKNINSGVRRGTSEDEMTVEGHNYVLIIRSDALVIQPEPKFTEGSPAGHSFTRFNINFSVFSNFLSSSGKKQSGV